jgi:hypothetical protein
MAGSPGLVQDLSPLDGLCGLPASPTGGAGRRFDRAPRGVPGACSGAWRGDRPSLSAPRLRAAALAATPALTPTPRPALRPPRRQPVRLGRHRSHPAPREGAAAPRRCRQRQVGAAAVALPARPPASWPVRAASPPLHPPSLPRSRAGEPGQQLRAVNHPAAGGVKPASSPPPSSPPPTGHPRPCPAPPPDCQCLTHPPFPAPVCPRSAPACRPFAYPDMSTASGASSPLDTPLGSQRVGSGR